MLGSHIRGACSEIVKQAYLSFALHFCRGLRHGIEQPPNLPVVARDRAVGKGEVGLLRHVAALDEKLQVLRPCCRATPLHAFCHGPGQVPDLCPHLSGRRR